MQEIDKLNAHIAQVDVYRMNKELLHQYLLFMFSDEKVAVLLLKGKPDTISGIISGTMKAALTLPLYFSIEILVRLKVIAANNLDDAERIELALQKLYRERIWQKLFPWLALAITIMLCMAMYFFSKK